MEYVNFGNAGVKVSRIAFGLGFRGQVSEDEAERTINHAIDSGVNFIDCANVYRIKNDAATRVEEVFGRVLKTRRDEVVFTTKVHGVQGEGHNDSGGARLHITREVERSLKRLNTDRIDIYLLHSYDNDTPLEETLRALDDLVSQGKVLYVGCCNFAAWQVTRALWIQDSLNADAFICVQNPYSLLNRSLEREMFGLLGDQGLGAMVYSPLAVGLLSGQYVPGEDPPDGSPWAARDRSEYKATMASNAKAINTVREIAAERSKTPAQVAMSWVLSQPEITVAISGSDTASELDDNLGAVGWQLEQDEISRLNQASNGNSEEGL